MGDAGNVPQPPAVPQPQAQPQANAAPQPRHDVDRILLWLDFETDEDRDVLIEDLGNNVADFVMFDADSVKQVIKNAREYSLAIGMKKQKLLNIKRNVNLENLEI